MRCICIRLLVSHLATFFLDNEIGYIMMQKHLISRLCTNRTVSIVLFLILSLAARKCATVCATARVYMLHGQCADRLVTPNFINPKGERESFYYRLRILCA